MRLGRKGLASQHRIGQSEGMPLDDIEIAWVRFVAMRDQLIAARDAENAHRIRVVLPSVADEAPAAIDLRDAVTDPIRMATQRDRRRWS
jgi:hypothetical protein